MMTEKNCSLCRRDPIAPQPYSDDVMWETVCPVHSEPMFVLNVHRHYITEEEKEHM